MIGVFKNCIRYPIYPNQLHKSFYVIRYLHTLSELQIFRISHHHFGRIIFCIPFSFWHLNISGKWNWRIGSVNAIICERLNDFCQIQKAKTISKNDHFDSISKRIKFYILCQNLLLLHVLSAQVRQGNSGSFVNFIASHFHQNWRLYYSKHRQMLIKVQLILRIF